MNPKIVIDKIRNLSNPTILFIGANRGDELSNFDNSFSNGIMHLIEPEPKLKDTILGSASKLKNFQYKYHTFAISDEEKEVDWFTSSGLCSGTILQPGNFPNIKNSGHTVQCKSLDQFVEEEGIKHIDLIWCDAEGSEMEILRGGQKAFGITNFALLEIANAWWKPRDKDPISNKKVLEILKSFSYNYEIVLKQSINILIKNTKFN